MPAAMAPLRLLLLVAATALGVARADSPCLACHEERSQARVTHFPAAAGLCETCHQVQPRHLEDGDAGAVSTLRSAEKTCFTCQPSRLCGHCHGDAMGLPPAAAPPPWNEQDARP